MTTVLPTAPIRLLSSLRVRILGFACSSNPIAVFRPLAIWLSVIRGSSCLPRWTPTISCCRAGLQRQLDFMQQHPEASVACSYAQLIDRNGKVIGSSHTVVDVHRGRESGTRICSSKSRTPRRLSGSKPLREVGGYSDRFHVAVDRELWGRLVTSGHLIAVMPETLIQYRLHQSSVTAKDMFDHHFTCEFIDFNIVRRLNGEAQVTLNRVSSAA